MTALDWLRDRLSCPLSATPPEDDIAHLERALGDLAVRFWACPDHPRGTVEWSGPVAFCQVVWCDRSSATPPETAERTVDHCLNCNGPVIERDGRRMHKANGELACPAPETAGGGQA